MTKLTEEQFNHYLKGGYFKVIYNPTYTRDLSHESLSMIGKETVAYQNMIINPLNDVRWKGEHAFNSPDIYGWFPERDIVIKGIINEFLPSKDIVKPPVYMYCLTYTRKEQMEGNFGIHWADSMMKHQIFREYSCPRDNYIMVLSNPMPTIIQKTVWEGKYGEKLQWETMYDERERAHRYQ